MSMEGLEQLFATLGDMRDKASVKAVFGEPERVGDKVVIPVAQVSYGFGVGFGQGQGPATAAGEVSGGGGGGGGGGVTARPVAVVEVTPEYTRVQEIADATRIALGGLALVAWAVFWIAATVRRGRRSEA